MNQLLPILEQGYERLMVLDYIILIGSWVITIMLLFLLIPKDKIRLAHVAFLFKQLITWVLGLSVVELKWIEFPVRWFSYANRSSFTFDYFVYPAICAIFNVHYPEGKNKIKKFFYYAAYCSIMTSIEVLFERFTHLIHYIDWAWYWTWISLFITFRITRLYVCWFCKLK
ncbi:MAG TPA: CBO0543 family protein [Bacillota bacterium]|nr:CBO0543 family protein [Bacillota bacterium]